MRAFGYGWVGLLLASTLGCGRPSFFTGRVNGNFFEPTGTIFAWKDNLTKPPELQNKTPSRFLVAGVYAYFDAATDQETLSGGDLSDLRHEIEINDWLLLEFADSNLVTNGATFKGVAVRDGEENIYRLQDPRLPASGACPNFCPRLRFRRTSLSRNSRYDCPTGTSPFFCQQYRPVGSKATVSVTVDSLTQAEGSLANFHVNIVLEKLPSDPEDAYTGSLDGSFNGSVVSERVAENNMAILDLYNTFGVLR